MNFEKEQSTNISVEDFSYKQQDEDPYKPDDSENLEDEKPLSLKRYDIMVYPADFTLSVLVDKLKQGEIIVPEFQRKYVWDIKRASKLIESFLIGLPVPPVYLYLLDDKLMIIDGQQRMKTIQFFFEEKFPDGKGSFKPFKLTFRDSLTPGVSWEGKSYSELKKEDQVFLSNSVMRAFIIRQVNPQDTTSTFYIFERLNTGGMILYPMELRKAIYFGNFIKLLEELNKILEWRKIIGSEKPDNRLRDVEYILRFFALFENWEHYESPIKSFLTEFMAYNRNIPENKENFYRQVFTEIVTLTYKALGNIPFHTHKSSFKEVPGGKKRLNLAVMDSFLVVLARKLFFEKRKISNKDVQKAYETLKKNENFLRNIKERDTTRTKVLKERILIVNSVFDEILKER